MLALQRFIHSFVSSASSESLAQALVAAQEAAELREEVSLQHVVRGSNATDASNELSAKELATETELPSVQVLPPAETSAVTLELKTRPWSDSNANVASMATEAKLEEIRNAFKRAALQAAPEPRSHKGDLALADGESRARAGRVTMRGKYIGVGRSLRNLLTEGDAKLEPPDRRPAGMPVGSSHNEKEEERVLDA